MIDNKCPNSVQQKRRENMFWDNVPRSCTQIKKSRGPKIDPCGTPHVMSRDVDSTFMKHKYCCLFAM